MKYSEKWGDSIDSAVELALQDLKLSKDQVTVTVLEQPSKGFFGLGSKLAKVRVEERKEQKAEEQKAPKPAEKKKEEKKAEKQETEEKCAAGASEKTAGENKKRSRSRNKNRKKNGVRQEVSPFDEIGLVSKKPDNLMETEEHPAKEFLEQVARDMGIEVSVKVSVNEDSVYVDIEGKDTGTVIGKRGATLDAVQYLTSLVVNKDENNYIRVVVDAEGYRAKREATLEKLAQKLAEKAVKTGKNVRLEPMNPYERKVIHTTLQGVPSVTTRSEGNEPFRRVVIVPARE